MTTAEINALIEKIAAEFAPLDAEILEEKMKAAVVMMDKYAELKALRTQMRASADPAVVKQARDTYWYYNRQMDIFGSKQMIGNAHSLSALQSFMGKMHVAAIAARNATIAKKLIASGIESFDGFVKGWSKNGFNGTFHIQTNHGLKVVNIKTIIAGGYNIVVRHYRVLVTVK